MAKMEIRLAGSGGQGIILATVILAEAAIIAGKHTAQSQSYGPEARGGACKAEVIVSDTEIGFTKVQTPTFLMALTQKSLDKYSKNLPKDCLVLIDEGLSVPQNLDGYKVIKLPILSTADEKVGRLMTANIVAVAAINGLLKLVDDESLKTAVFMHIPKGTEALNEKALNEGFKLIENGGNQ